MNNFFFDTSDYSLFKKALKVTDNEPVVISILSTDSSLQTKSNKTNEPAAARKNMSRKFEPSPFGKFFGPRKQQSVSVDMKDFSSWKNKNYRKAEENINESSLGEVRFSMSDFMNDSSKQKFNELDQAKSDMQKPITQLSTDDPLYKKFSLDSYMHKLEEQSKVKGQFEENDDILEPLGDKTQLVVPDSTQDENFSSGSNVDIMDITFDENISGDKFSFEKEELDKFRARLDKIEREAANIKEKTTEKVISTNELSEITGDFDIDNLTNDDDDNIEVDDIEKVNAKFAQDEEDDANSEKPQVKHKTFFEINKSDSLKKKAKEKEQVELQETKEKSAVEEFDEKAQIDSHETIDDDTVDSSESPNESEEFSDSDLYEDVSDENDASQKIEGIEKVGDTSSNEESDSQLQSIVSTTNRIDRNDIVTKDDLKSMTDELMTKFTELYKKDENVSDYTQFVDTEDGSVPYVDEYSMGQNYGTAQDPYGYGGMNYVAGQTYSGQNENEQLKAQLQELIKSNKELDLQNEQRLKEIELEKERVAADYENRIKEMEKSFKQNYEDFKKQAYLDKLDRDIKLKEAESKFKKKAVEIKEQEKASFSKEKTGEMLRKELKSNFNISNLEMDKKLLEIASKLHKTENDRLNDENDEMARRLELETAKVKELEEDIEEFEDQTEDVIEEVEEEPEEKKTTKKSPGRKSTTRRRKTTTTRKPSTRKGSRRKIDSDIIGGIDFE